MDAGAGSLAGAVTRGTPGAGTSVVGTCSASAFWGGTTDNVSTTTLAPEVTQPQRVPSPAAAF